MLAVVTADRFTNPLSPEECDELLNQFNANSDATRALLDDYRYYLKFGKRRRPEGVARAPDRVSCGAQRSVAAALRSL
jgi:hypothetical protein